MRLQCIGLNHNAAPISLREKMSLDEEGIRSALARLSSGNQSKAAAELVILSTCNRIELYSASNQSEFADLETYLAEISGLPIASFQQYLYRYQDIDVARHLFDVTAGLDSLVIGEPQILGQALQALEFSRGQNTSGPVLNRLFQAAVHAGKRARTETAIGRNPSSVSSLAASWSERAVHRLAEAEVVILGAGEMAELAVEALRKRGAKRITVVNRTVERAHALAKRWDAQATTFEHLDTALESADILIASTGAPHVLITGTMVREAMQARPQRPLVLIDIAVPRDIDPETASIEHVRLYDIDNLNEQLEHSLTDRMAEVPRVKAILASELDGFDEYLKSLEVLPVIADIHQQAESIRQAELERTLRHLPDLTAEERKRIDILTQSLVSKILVNPTNRLHAEASLPNALQYAALARSLFGLEGGQNQTSSAGSISPTVAD